MKTQTGFTLIEILAVVILLGILASIVGPMLASASDDARASALLDDLRVVRAQCELYRLEHDGAAAGYPSDGGAPTEVMFVAQLISVTDLDGNVGNQGDPGMDHGPYLQRFPTNPINGRSTILVLDDGDPQPAAPSGVFGWIYKPLTGRFRSDATGTDPSGDAFFDY